MRNYLFLYIEWLVTKHKGLKLLPFARQWIDKFLLCWLVSILDHHSLESMFGNIQNGFLIPFVPAVECGLLRKAWAIRHVSLCTVCPPCASWMLWLAEAITDAACPVAAIYWAVKRGQKKWYTDRCRLCTKCASCKWHIDESVRLPKGWWWVQNDIMLQCLIMVLISYARTVRTVGVWPPWGYSTSYKTTASWK